MYMYVTLWKENNKLLRRQSMQYILPHSNLFLNFREKRNISKVSTDKEYKNVVRYITSWMGSIYQSNQNVFDCFFTFFMEL